MNNYDIDNEIIDLDRENPQKNRAPKNRKHKKRKFKRAFLMLSPLFFVTAIVFIVMFIVTVISYRKNITENEKEIAKINLENEEKIRQVIDSMYSEEQVNEFKEQAYNDGKYSSDTLTFIREESSKKGASLAEILRQLYKNDIVYLTNNGYEFTPINKDYPLNNVKPENLILDDNNILTYLVNDETKSSKGIDVSEHQGEINWKLVAEDGVDFTMIRIGYRGYGSGKLVDDAEFENNIKGALNNNIDTGVYYFTQAINQEEMQEELDVIFEAIKPYKFNGPVAIDIEKVDGSNARGNNISKEERTALVLYFCEKVRAAGYTPMIYGNTNSLFAMLDIEQIHDELIWFAFYNPEYLYYPYELEYWQYSSTGSVKGVTGEVDLNIRFNK